MAPSRRPPAGRRSQRQRARAERREAQSGSGPVRSEQGPGRWPGATGAFALFGEVMVTGVVVLLVAIPVLTLPLALAVGVRHLRRYLLAEVHGVREVVADLRRGLLPSLVLGLGVLLLSAVLALDIALGRDGVLPGGRVVEVAGWLGLAVLGLVLVVAARSWSPEEGWRAALRRVPQELGADPVGACYVLVAVGFVALMTWQLPPLLLPALGLLVFASLAVPERLVARG